MRKHYALATAALTLSLASGAHDALAFGGSGNLSPEASPYAILSPETLGPASVPPDMTPPPTTDEQPTGSIHRAARHRPHPNNE